MTISYPSIIFQAITVLALLVNFTLSKSVFLLCFKIIFAEYFKKFLRDKFSAEFLAFCLNQLRKFRVHFLWKVISEVMAHYKCGAALT